MGWWETNKKDDVIGDGPADILTDALIAINKEFGKDDQVALSLTALLDAFLVTLRQNPELVSAPDQDLSASRLLAKLEDGTQATSSSKAKADKKRPDHQVRTGGSGPEPVMGGQSAGTVAHGHAADAKTEKIGQRHAQAGVAVGHPL